jgi:transposase InsO family protein
MALPGSGLPANRERGRVGRLMRENAIVVERTRKFKVEEGQ